MQIKKGSKNKKLFKLLVKFYRYSKCKVMRGVLGHSADEGNWDGEQNS
jgi:hypothetical protein